MAYDLPKRIEGKDREDILARLLSFLCDHLIVLFCCNLSDLKKERTGSCAGTIVFLFSVPQCMKERVRYSIEAM